MVHFSKNFLHLSFNNENNKTEIHPVRVYGERERKKEKERRRTSDSRKNWGRCVDCAARLSRNVCISRFVAATFRKKKKKKVSSSPSNPTIPSSSPHVPDALLSAPRILYFFFLFFGVVNVTPSNDINVTRACHAFARLFENNRISGGRERERIRFFFCE